MLDTDARIAQFFESMKAKGRVVPTRLAEIEGFPSSDYPEMVDAIRCGYFSLSKFTFHYDGDVFNAVATKGERNMGNIAHLVQLGGPLAAAVAAFFVSWWLLLAVPVLFVVGAKMAKANFLKTLFRSAMTSEPQFCFLYYLKQISLFAKKNDTLYYWGMEPR